MSSSLLASRAASFRLAARTLPCSSLQRPCTPSKNLSEKFRSRLSAPRSSWTGLRCLNSSPQPTAAGRFMQWLADGEVK